VEVEVLDVERRRFQDDLKLIVLAETEGVIAVTPVCGTAGRLHVRDLPRLGAEDAEEGRRMHGAGADFEVERRLDHASALGPETLEREDERLKGDARHWA